MLIFLNIIRVERCYKKSFDLGENIWSKFEFGDPVLNNGMMMKQWNDDVDGALDLGLVILKTKTVANSKLILGELKRPRVYFFEL